MLATPEEMAKFVGLFKERGVTQTYRKGEYIIRPGEKPPGIFYINSGLVKAYDITKYGEENMLIIRKDGELFPLIWAITGQERHVIYQAVVPTTTWEIGRQTFLDYLSLNPRALAPILDMTVESYRQHSERILTLEYRTVRERIISFLNNMSQSFGIETDDGLLINVPLRHQDIASSVNATRETTSRELAVLERRGLVKSKQSMIVIKDLAGLQKFLR